MKGVLAVSLAVLSAVCAVSAVNNRPIVGILTLPCDSDCGSATEYFPASYVKAVESGGARVVPIHYTASAASITSLLGNVNGVLFTGGGASLDPGSAYFAAVQTIYNYVVSVNGGGDYFPLWGTCLGFESICRAASEDPNILTGFDSENYTIPLNFTAFAGSSRMFDATTYPQSEQVMALLSSYPITMNNHVEGVTPSDFASHSSLADVFDVLSTNVDRNGREFVSLIEAKQMPIFGAQFHSEKPMYEWWAEEVIQHTHEAITANSFFMQFFIDQVRQNTHSFPANVQPDFIYNYAPFFSDDEFTQIYRW